MRQEINSQTEKDSYPFITIVMPVRNEERFIADTLNQLLSQDYPKERFEIIIADGHSTDKTWDIVQNMAAQFPQIRFIPNPGRLSSSGRNVGFQNGKGDYFIVVDGHCRLKDNQLFRNVARLFQGYQVDCLARPQPLITPEQPGWQRAIAKARSSFWGHSVSSDIYSETDRYVCPVSAGCAYSKKVFATIGYVDETFDAGEDLEFNYRVKKAGFKAYISPKIAVYYYPRENLKGLWKQLIRYGIGRAKFTLKHPETFSFEMLLPVLLVGGILISPFLILFKPSIAFLFLGAFLLYSGILLFVSLRIRTEEPWKFVLKVFLVLFTIHHSIGVGILKGFASAILSKFRWRKPKS